MYPKDVTEINPADTVDKPCVSSQTSSRHYSLLSLCLMEWQSYEKKKKYIYIKTCQDLATEVCNKLDCTLQKYDETHLIFDTYLENSLKNSMRRKRAGKTTPVELKITGSTNITNIGVGHNKRIAPTYSLRVVKGD